MAHRMVTFAFVSFLPVPLITMAAIFGGWWVVLSCLYITVFAFMLDQLIPLSAIKKQPKGVFSAANFLSAVLAISHFFYNNAGSLGAFL